MCKMNFIFVFESHAQNVSFWTRNSFQNLKRSEPQTCLVPSISTTGQSSWVTCDPMVLQKDDTTRPGQTGMISDMKVTDAGFQDSGGRVGKGQEEGLEEHLQKSTD